mmetsp:Transcript_68707/g.199325  ORF Transcript_68707/g.199325 Transcript_68707/m.199325 type:complete len:298 (+) Transcript_68707:531-1424(+)
MKELLLHESFRPLYPGLRELEEVGRRPRLVQEAQAGLQHLVLVHASNDPIAVLCLLRRRAGHLHLCLHRRGGRALRLLGFLRLSELLSTVGRGDRAQHSGDEIPRRRLGPRTDRALGPQVQQLLAHVAGRPPHQVHASHRRLRRLRAQFLQPRGDALQAGVGHLALHVELLLERPVLLLGGPLPPGQPGEWASRLRALLRDELGLRDRCVQLLGLADARAPLLFQKPRRIPQLDRRLDKAGPVGGRRDAHLAPTGEEVLDESGILLGLILHASVVEGLLQAATGGIEDLHEFVDAGR